MKYPNHWDGWHRIDEEAGFWAVLFKKSSQRRSALLLCLWWSLCSHGFWGLQIYTSWDEWRWTGVMILRPTCRDAWFGHLACMEGSNECLRLTSTCSEGRIIPPGWYICAFRVVAKDIDVERRKDYPWRTTVFACATVIANCSWTKSPSLSCEEGSCECQAMNSLPIWFLYLSSLKILDAGIDHMGIRCSLEIVFALHWTHSTKVEVNHNVMIRMRLRRTTNKQLTFWATCTVPESQRALEKNIKSWLIGKGDDDPDKPRMSSHFVTLNIIYHATPSDPGFWLSISYGPTDWRAINVRGAGRNSERGSIRKIER